MHKLHLVVARDRAVFGRVGKFARLGGVGSVLAGLGRYLRDRGGELFDRTGLLGSALRYGLAAFGDLLRARRHLLGSGIDLHKILIEIFDDQVDGVFQFHKFSFIFRGDLAGEVGVGDAAENIGNLLDIAS